MYSVLIGLVVKNTWNYLYQITGYQSICCIITPEGPHNVDKLHMSLVMKNRIFAYAKTKTQISFAVTAKLISAFTFATRIVQFLFYLNPKFQASSHLLWLYSPVCVGPGRKPRRPIFSELGSYVHSKYCRIRGCHNLPLKHRKRRMKCGQ